MTNLLRWNSFFYYINIIIPRLIFGMNDLNKTSSHKFFIDINRDSPLSFITLNRIAKPKETYLKIILCALMLPMWMLIVNCGW